MRRPAAVALAVLLPLALAGCGQAGAADATGSTAPEPRADSPTASSSSASPSASVPAQPKGAHGVTYRILNWSEHAGNPAVLAWKRAYELGNASVNAGRMLPGAARIATKATQRLFVGHIQLAWSHQLHVRPVAKVRIQSAQERGPERELVACLWVPSTDFYQRDGRMYLGMSREWRRVRYQMLHRDGRWIIGDLQPQGTCPGGAPR